MGTVRWRRTETSEHGGAWQIIAQRRTPDGRRTLSRTVHDRPGRNGERRARQALADLERELDELIDADGEATDPGMTVAELAERWIEHRAASWSPSTLRNNRAQVARHVVPWLGDRRVIGVRARDLDELYRRLGESGLSASSVRRVHGLCSGMFTQALRWEMVDRSPAALASPPTVAPVEHELPDAARIRSLLVELDGRNLRLAALWAVAASTGARRSAVCGLQWGDLDLDGEAPAVTLSRAIVRGEDGLAVRVGGKSGKRSRKPLPAPAVERLVRWRDARSAAFAGSVGADRWVFSTALDGSAVPCPDAVTRAWRRASDRHGLEGVKMHGLRHWVATELLLAGAPQVEVERLLDHAPGTTSRFYAHALAEGARGRVEALTADL